MGNDVVGGDGCRCDGGSSDAGRGKGSYDASRLYLFIFFLFDHYK